jgi:hypothetical protein
MVNHYEKIDAPSAGESVQFLITNPAQTENPDSNRDLRRAGQGASCDKLVKIPGSQPNQSSCFIGPCAFSTTPTGLRLTKLTLSIYPSHTCLLNSDPADGSLFPDHFGK